ncbi:hypothetical protein [Streptomyces sp. MK37H]|uniref:hypothetical protein n=1 Tax=Streptomyces sp. MK37H TaxID=2699117 RepID=UPI001B384E18|nr:hypothetical protein [Streptomyces sp. MK37H]MBP8537291.1 hypothetical protein [Streptomyces sp. MK37H]
MTDTHDLINAHRQHLATLSDLLGFAAGCGRWDIHAKHETQRRELSRTLHAAVGAGLDDGTLSLEDAARALSPIASLETASVF